MIPVKDPLMSRPRPEFSGTDTKIALFLDFDGTLADIAPSPESVVVDNRIPPALAHLREHLAGAVALVSGRPITFLDKQFDPHRFDAAGLHGSQIRLAERVAEQAHAPDAIRDAARDLVRFANGNVGIIVEDKRLSVALHWRLAPHLEDEARALVRHLAERIGPGVRLQEGKAVAELVPAGASKGQAIGWLMQHEPFAGRLPVFIGDDVTDEDGFEVVNALGGLSIRIGHGDTCAVRRIASPLVLRQILIDAAARDRLTVGDFLLPVETGTAIAEPLAVPAAGPDRG